MNYHGKLRNKIVLVMALVGIVPIVVAGLVTRYVVTSSHRDDVAKLEQAVLLETGARIQGFINDGLLTQARIVVPAGSGAGVTAVAQQYVLTQTIRALSFIEDESFIDLQGKETVHLDRAHMDGYPASALRDMGADPGFLAARAGNPYLGPISISGDGTPTVLFATPVKTNDGAIVGVVTGTASLGTVGNAVAAAKVGNTGYLYLVDQKGTLLGGSDLVMKAAPSVAGLDAVQRVLSGEALLGPDAQARYRGVLGEDVVAAGVPLDEHGTRWGLMAEWPVAEADAVISTLFLKDLIVLAAALAVVLLISFFAAHFLTRPIKTLEEASERVARGKLDEGVFIATGDELEELGNAFNQMVQGLKQLEQLKDEFVFVAAHELRTPVAAMKGFLTLILEGTTGAISDATRASIEKVIRANDRLIQLVNDLLEVARSQAGRLTIKVAPVAIVPPIRSVLDELKSLADEKSVALAYAPSADLPDVLADADRVKEVVVNLVGNAIKYMGGAGTVTISHEVKDGALVTHVADTGLGISKEAQMKLFEKFYRVQTDRTQGITGTGLGLFIVKEIIEKMNGRIWVDSEEGKGSVFSFSLPVAA